MIRDKGSIVYLPMWIIRHLRQIKDMLSTVRSMVRKNIPWSNVCSSERFLTKAREMRSRFEMKELLSLSVLSQTTTTTKADTSSDGICLRKRHRRRHLRIANDDPNLDRMAH